MASAGAALLGRLERAEGSWLRPTSREEGPRGWAGAEENEPVLGQQAEREEGERKKSFSLFFQIFSILFPNLNPNANQIKFEYDLKYIFLIQI